MYKSFVCGVCIALFSCFSLVGQHDYVRRIVEDLCSPEFHGRGYVNGGDSLAAVYLATEFKALGLQSLTDNYYQEFSFSVNTFPGVAQFFHAGKKLIVGDDILVHPASGSYRGELFFYTVPLHTILGGLSVESLVQSVTESGKNCIVVDMRAVAADSLQQWRKIRMELAEHLPVIELTDKKFIWSVSKKQLNHPILEVKSLNVDQSMTVNLDARWVENHRTRNVVAYLPAKKATKRTLVFTAHYDHLGRLGQDTYFPGANDNASGTSMLLSLARHFIQDPISCNVLFIACAGEEIGLLGSKYYVENPIIPLEDMLFVVNLDIVGSGEEGVSVVNGDTLQRSFALLERINNKNKLVHPLVSRGTAANSDHHYFFAAGVPAFFLYTMGPSKHYHDIFDTADNLSLAEIDDLRWLLVYFAKEIAKKPKSIRQ